MPKYAVSSTGSSKYVISARNGFGALRVGIAAIASSEPDKLNDADMAFHVVRLNGTVKTREPVPEIIDQSWDPTP
jgi:hypothetical protein